ncbi:MAG TPA: efflux RND transporter permease subunit [Chthoniobacteraceae bacterium]|nr:efflux RND transporter permease subunit [Chthoniobacteraceae bacterium]
MWIVKLALNRPYTFIVAALLLLIMTPVTVMRTPVDIFPNINIPVVSIVWQYNGMAAKDFEGNLTWPFERVLTTTVNDIEHIESQTLNGISVVKVFFQPNAKIETALAQVTAISQTVLKGMPPGTTPPLIITYNASSVPILQLGLSSTKLSEKELNDYAMNFVRVGLTTVPGAAVPWPYGGKVRQITVDIDLNQLNAHGLSPNDVAQAINAQNLILPGGTAKIGSLEYDVEMNGRPQVVDELNNLPVKTVNGTVVYVRDVAHVRDGFQVQTNIVRQDGQRGSLLSVYKTGNASTIDIVKQVKEALPRIASTLPPELRIQPMFDQSIFVSAAVQGVIKEAIIAACLTAAMILLFLGNWRHTVVIAISIPLSIFSAIIILSALGETINIMTLGGLALAVGILVDDATVTIENIDRNLAEGKPLHDGILDGAAQIATPAFVSTLCICIVFVPMFFLAGVARYLFVPLAEAVVFAMLSSYVLSRTLVPTLVMYFLRNHPELHGHHAAAPRTIFGRMQQGFERGFERFRESYGGWLERCLHLRWKFIGVFFTLCVLSVLLVGTIGQDFFPSVDAGQFKLHMRVRTATRIEETARYADLVEQSIRQKIPANELTSILDNIGLPYSGINTSYSNNGTIGTADAEILVSLNTEHHGPTAAYVSKLRADLPKEFPGIEFFFQPADIVSQILNFGLSAPIDIQFDGNDVDGNLAIAEKVAEQIRHVPGAVDTHVHQLFNQPKLELDVDRTKADQLGLTERDVANSLLVATSSSFQVAPAFWLNPQNGVNYNLAVQGVQYHINSLQDIYDLPITSANGSPTQLLVNIADLKRLSGPAVLSHRDTHPVIDVLVSVQGRDLGGVARDVQKIVDNAKGGLKRGNFVTIRGQVQTMHDSFKGLAFGLLFSVVLVYLLIVVNFQSWVDPFIIITALPGALAGIAWILFLTGTTLSVPALMGAIMCIGVATANSILVVTFAREQLALHGDAVLAALEAGRTRLRPVVMTALAMVIGMLPMSLGLGEGGEQNAPLGRAVIGGLIVATVATLFFVPVVFAAIRGRKSRGFAKNSRPATPEHAAEIEGALARGHGSSIA